MNTFNKLLNPFQKAFKQSVSSFILLETADGETTIVSSDGSLVSYLRIEGSRHIIGDEEYEHIIEAATIKIGARFDRAGHAVQIYFARDPGRIRKELEKQIYPSRLTAKNAGIDMDDVLEERVNHLERFLTHEEMYFVVWTRPAVLTKNEIKSSGKEARAKAEEEKDEKANEAE